MNNDICRCTGSLCPIAETCKRFVVPGGEWTPYCDFSLHMSNRSFDGEKECLYFIPIERVE